MKLDRKNLFIEVPLLVVSSVSLFVFFQKTSVARAFHSDVAWYLDAALNNLSDFLIWASRYTHIYLLKIFYLFSENPFEVGVNFWSFVMAASSLLVYLIGKSLTPKSTYIHGILAVSFFISINYFFQTQGVPLVDYTCMLLVLITSYVFLLSSKGSHRSSVLLLCLGLFLYLAFKTKETAWVVAIYLVGLMLDENEAFSLDIFIQRFKWVMLGAISGILLFALLDGIFLKDFLFRLRPSNILFAVNSFSDIQPSIRVPGNWYDNVVFQTVPYIFLFSLIALAKNQPKLPMHSKLIWSYPFLFVLAVTLPQLTAEYDLFLTRFILPAFAVLSITAAQIIDLDRPSSKKEALGITLTFMAGAVFLYYVWRGTEIFANLHKINHPQLIYGYFFPVVFSVVVLLALFVKKFPFYFSFIPFFFIFALLIQPIKENFKSLTFQEEIYSRQPVFYPFLQFADQIEYTEDMKMYISPTLINQEGYLLDNIDTVVSVFDLVMHEKAKRDNFIIQVPLDNTLQDLSEHTYNYILLANTDWDNLNAYPDSKSMLLDTCGLFHDDLNSMLFISCP